MTKRLRTFHHHEMSTFSYVVWTAVWIGGLFWIGIVLGLFFFRR